MGIYEFFINHPALSTSKILVWSEKLTVLYGSLKISELSGYEKTVKKTMAHFIKDGDYVIDVGAHFGFHTIPMSRYVKSGRVYAIEPGNKNLVELKTNTAKHPNIHIIPYAASDKSGTAILYQSQLSSVHSIIYKPPKYTSNLTIKTIQLDNIFHSDLERQKVSLIKVDVEGSELLVLKGATKILQNPSLKLIIEFFPEQWIEAGIYPGVFDFLEEKGFKKFYDINERLNKLVRVNNPRHLKEYNHFIKYTNLLCLK